MATRLYWGVSGIPNFQTNPTIELFSGIHRNPRKTGSQWLTLWTGSHWIMGSLGDRKIFQPLGGTPMVGSKSLKLSSTTWKTGSNQIQLPGNLRRQRRAGLVIGLVGHVGRNGEILEYSSLSRWAVQEAPEYSIDSTDSAFKRLASLQKSGSLYVYVCSKEGGIAYLVGGLEHFLFSHSVENVIIPIDELLFFRWVGLNHQPVMFPGSLKSILQLDAANEFFRL